MGVPSPFERHQDRSDKRPSTINVAKRGLAAAGVIFAPLALADCAPAFGSEPKSYVSRAAPPDTPTPGGIQSIRIGDGGTVTVNYFPTTTPALSTLEQRPELRGAQATRVPSPTRPPEPSATRPPESTRVPPTPRPTETPRPAPTLNFQPSPVAKIETNQTKKEKFRFQSSQKSFSFDYDPTLWTKVNYKEDPLLIGNPVLFTLVPIGGAFEVRVGVSEPLPYKDASDYFSSVISKQFISYLSTGSRRNITLDGKPGLEYQTALDPNLMNVYTFRGIDFFIGVYIKDDKSRFWTIQFDRSRGSNSAKMLEITNQHINSFRGILSSFKLSS